ncbi:MAG: hypothetical protein R2864_02600 [Syntrophotaleaceae bacterium]
MENLGNGNFGGSPGMTRKDEIGRMANAIDACVGTGAEGFERSARVKYFTLETKTGL